MHPLYEVGLFDAEADRMHLRTWDGQTVERSLSYLRAQNRRGWHIYLRPAGHHPFTLLDDLDHERVEMLRDSGFALALIVETSPGNMQAWINHGQILPPELSTAVAQHLAEVFGADPSSADWRHFGRLAGFTNRKPKYQQPNGHYPFVRLLESSGVINPTSDQVIQTAREILEKRKADDAAARARVSDYRGGTVAKSIQDFRNAPAYGGDGHRADLAYATYALAHGESPRAVEAAIRSRDLSHKGGESRIRDYVDRTIAKANEAIVNRRTS
jgi:hypothetical protein